MSQFSRLFASLIVCSAVLASAQAQTATVTPANEAAAHVNEWATVEGVVAKGFTSKSGNTLLNIGAAYPNQTFTGWIFRLGPVGRIEIYKGKPENRINAASQLEIQ
jgi:hypothetical protein